MNPRPTQRKPSAERREEIANATLRIIGERGLAALTTAAVAEQVGVTSGALFRHFSSRDEILGEAVQHAVNRLAATFPDASLAPAERLRAFVERRVTLLSAEPGIAWLLLSNQAYVSLPSQAVASLERLIGRSRRYLVELMREGAAEGTIRDDIEPELLVVTVIGTVHAIVQPPDALRLGGAPSLPDPARVLEGLMRLLAAGSPHRAPVEPCPGVSPAPRRRK